MKPGQQAAVGRRRHLHRSHFAFFRAMLEGVPVEAVWDRYLSVEGQHTDLRLVPATVSWIRSELAAAAARADRPGTARLLRLDVERLVQACDSLPSLEQFAEEAGLEDERQADQIEAYQARYGKATARLRKRQALLQRQLAALRWLEAVAARDPLGGDAVVSWFRPEVARFLAAADIFTLAQLAERIHGLGQGWSRSIRGIGPLKAQRIAAWVAEQSATIGVAIGTHVQRPRRQVPADQLAQLVSPAADIRPLDKLIVPAELDGRAGRFRQPQEHCLLAADNDYDAILAWLRSRQGCRPAHSAGDPGAAERLSHTQRSYRKEAERFLLWAIVARRKALSSMTAEDCMEYARFLADPQPRARWCGPRSRERWSPLWRPFEGPLSPAGQRQAITILKGLYGFLVDQNYLMGNPWAAVPPPWVTQPGSDVSRSLTAQQWAVVRDRAQAAGQHSAAIRLRLALNLLYATGLRASEAVAARVGDLRAVDYVDSDAGERVSGWTLAVVGKGQRMREVPIPESVVDELRRYLQHRGLGAELVDPGVKAAPILAAVTDLDERAPGLARAASAAEPIDRHGPGETAITESTLYRQLRSHFESCAEHLRHAGDAAGAQRLERASTHWMRHTHASHALASGVKLQVTQENLGHASLNTTTAYVTTEKAQRMRAMTAFWREAGKR